MRLRCSTAAISFLARVRCRTSAARRASQPAQHPMRSSPTHTAGIMSGRQQLAPTSRASNRSVFTRAWLIARTSWALASTTSATCGSRIRAIASALPVASNTTRSSAPGSPANSSNAAGRVAIRPAERARPPSAIATSQKSRCTSKPIASHPPLSLRSTTSTGDRRAERQLRIRARSATGQVAGAASYTNGLAAHNEIAGLPDRVLPRAPAPISRRYDPTRTEAPTAVSCR